MMRGLLVAASSSLVLVLVACGAAPHTRGTGAVGPLSVKPVGWNPTGAPLGHVRAVADAGDVVAVFADDGATIFSGRAPVATDRSVSNWVDAETIAGADGAARWIVGVDGRGRLYYLHGMSSFEDVSARYGLDGERVLGAALLGTGYVGFLLGGEIAIADGRSVTRYGAGPFSSLVGGGGYGAGITGDGLQVFDAARKSVVRYALPGVTHAAFGPKGRLYAATSRAVYAADDQGELALLYDAEGDSIHGLVASGEHVWFADGSELGAIEGDRVVETAGAKVASDATLSSSPRGDVWILAQGKLDRFARLEAEPQVASAWNTALAPIFAHVCSSCHQPDGESGTDLSSAEAWQSERTNILDRVVVHRTMPPQGHPLSDADREAIRAWAEGK